MAQLANKWLVVATLVLITVFSAVALWEINDTRNSFQDQQKTFNKLLLLQQRQQQRATIALLEGQLRRLNSTVQEQGQVACQAITTANAAARVALAVAFEKKNVPPAVKLLVNSQLKPPDCSTSPYSEVP